LNKYVVSMIFDVVGFAAINEEENIRNIRTFSKILEFPAYENI